MGSSQSLRKLTISNDDAELLNISTALIERLTQSVIEDDNKDPKQRQEETLSNKINEHLDHNAAVKATSDYNNITPTPMNQAISPPISFSSKNTLSALEMQQQKERELEHQDQYWQKRLQNIEKNHLVVNQIFNDEHKKAIEEFSNKKGPVHKIEGAIIPCQENSERVLKCYQDHPKEILKCADLVEQFSNCVELKRATVIAAR